MRDRAGWGRGTLPPGCPHPCSPFRPPPSCCCHWARWEVIPSPRTLPCHFNFPMCARWGCTVKVNFTLDFLLRRQFQTCRSHLYPLLLLSLHPCVLGRCGGGCPGPAGRLPRDLSARAQALGSKGRGQGHPSGTKWALCGGTGPAPRDLPGELSREFTTFEKPPCHSLNGSGVGAQGQFLVLCALLWPSHSLYALLWGYNPRTGLVPLIFPGPGSLLVPGVLSIPRLSCLDVRLLPSYCLTWGLADWSRQPWSCAGGKGTWDPQVAMTGFCGLALEVQRR